MSDHDQGHEATLVTLPITEVFVREDFNPRSQNDAEALSGLVASIAAHGVLQPILVGEREQAGHPLIAGHRRLEAARRAGLELVPALVRYGGDALVDALVENLQRADLSPIEEARGFQRAVAETGLRTHKALAERLGKPAAFVSERLRLLKLPAAAQEPLHARSAPLSIAPVLLRVATVSPQLAVALAQAVARGQVDADELLSDLPAVVAYALPQAKGIELPYLAPVGRRLSLEDLLPRTGFEELHERYEALPRDRYGYRQHYLYFSLADDERDQARAFGCLLALPAGSEPGYGPPSAYVCDRDWVADRVREQLAGMERQAADERRATEEREAQERRGRLEAAGAEVDGASLEELERVESERRRFEREAEKRARVEARGANLELGRRLAECLHAPELTLDVARLLALLVLGEDTSPLCARGLRYVSEGLQEVELRTLKSGETRERITYHSPTSAEAHMWAWLERARTPQQILGRVLQTLIAAHCADEAVLPRSQRIGYRVPGTYGGGAAAEIPTLIERLADDLLPTRLRELTRERQAERERYSSWHDGDRSRGKRREPIAADAADAAPDGDEMVEEGEDFPAAA